MEHGFYHPSRGYWQTIGDVPPHILATYPAGTIEVPLKPSADYEWDGEWVQVTLDPAEALAAERAAMVATPAQMRLTLHRMGLLATVQAIADADPEASIVWEYALTIQRTSPLIDALGGPEGFTPEQIDDLFRAAMAVDI